VGKDLNIRRVFFGPPGTGKTETLLRQMTWEATQESLDSRQIAFVGFTRQAAYGARYRAATELQTTERRLPWFRTLHSVAFRINGMSRSMMMDDSDYAKIAEAMGYRIGPRSLLPGEGNEFERALFVRDYAINRMISLDEAWSEVDVDLDQAVVSWVEATVARYKTNRNKYEFSDLLAFTQPSLADLGVKVAFIDEAQDLTALQWKCVRQLLEGVPAIYVAGDDDQCIFRWSGARVEDFLELPGERTVLDASYRVPRLVWEVAQSIASRISVRQDKSWSPASRPGEVVRVGSPDMVEFDTDTTSSWLLLGRTKKQCDELRAICDQNGVIYTYRGVSSVDSDHLSAIRTYLRIQRGSDSHCTAQEVSQMEELLGEDRVVDDTPWHEALVGVDAEIRERYLVALRRNPKALTALPNVRIDTIHGAKGAEADTVVLMTDVTKKVYDTMSMDPDSEHRTFYVGATRTRDRLIIVEPQGRRSYDV
jgi:superfamily I DNA/RNA helicase